jgi:hypothetical protein
MKIRFIVLLSNISTQSDTEDFAPQYLKKTKQSSLLRNKNFRQSQKGSPE